MSQVKEEVKAFYDQVGWQLVGEDVYQNARYEDLRPVARDYITRCHQRISRHLAPQGRLLLDAGSGPVQYPAYLEYSRGYQHRVCADISFTALVEARRRLGEHGLYVVTDVANLPFKPGAFDGVVSLHTIHHLPEDEHLKAYGELYRVLAPGRTGVIVNGWANSRMMDAWEPLVRFANSLRHLFDRLDRKRSRPVESDEDAAEAPLRPEKRRRDPGDRTGVRHRRSSQPAGETPKGTFTNKHDATWVKGTVGASMPVEVLVWRSVTVRFMRALVHSWLGGRLWLRWLYWLEERRPHYFGENGKYPLIVIRKSETNL